MAKKTSKGKAKKAVVRMVTMCEPSAAKLPPVGTIRWRGFCGDCYELRDDGVYWIRDDGSAVKQSKPTGPREQMIAWMDQDLTRIVHPLPDTAASRRKAVAAALAGSLHSTRKAGAAKVAVNGAVYCDVAYCIPAATYREFLAGGGA